MATGEQAKTKEVFWALAAIVALLGVIAVAQEVVL